MAQTFRSRPDHPGNEVAEIIDGIGARGSSISDVDNLTVIHDGGNGRPRFLFQELKHGDEALDKAQAWILRDLSVLPGVMAWTVRLVSGQAVEVTDHANSSCVTLSKDEYAQRVATWWGRQPTRCMTFAECDNDPEWHCKVCWRHLKGMYKPCPDHGFGT